MDGALQTWSQVTQTFVPAVTLLELLEYLLTTPATPGFVLNAGSCQGLLPVAKAPHGSPEKRLVVAPHLIEWASFALALAYALGDAVLRPAVSAKLRQSRRFQCRAPAAENASSSAA
jgi:hypothetical protein